MLVISPLHLAQPCARPIQSVTICARKYGRAEIGHFQAFPDVVAVAADKLVVIIRVDDDGSVLVRDLANGGLFTTLA